MKLGRSRIWMSMALLLGIATMGLGVPAGVPAGAAPGAPAALQGVGNASCFSPAPHGFSDVPTTSFANTAISWLVEAGITTGTTPTTFTPQGNTSRAQMAVFLWRNAGEPAPAGQQSFTDVPTTSFANTAISWLVEAGITTGTTPTTFTPQANTTRADMAVFLWRNAGEPAPAGQQHFTDVPTTSYANPAIAWLVEAGITTGTTPTTFTPQANVTRAEMAVFLWRYNCPDPNLGNVTTLAGNGTRGFADGPGNTAQFNNPYGVAFAPNGNIYVADTYNQRIRVTNPTTGQVTTLAGTGTEGFADGPGTNARFNYPTGVAVAPNGNIYVADQGNQRIRAINPTTRSGHHPRRNRHPRVCRRPRQHRPIRLPHRGGRCPERHRLRRRPGKPADPGDQPDHRSGHHPRRNRHRGFCRRPRHQRPIQQPVRGGGRPERHRLRRRPGKPADPGDQPDHRSGHHPCRQQRRVC
jgi:hypothetical protein